MKYGTVAQIPYGKDAIDVDGIQFIEWEDRLDAAKVTASSTIGQWITYDFLIELGYFVSKPKVARPKKDSPKPTKKVHPNTPKTAKGDSWEIRSQPPQEPVWTQSRILSERERLVRHEERLLKKQKTALAKQAIQQEINRRQPTQFVNDDGTPYSTGNYVSALIALTFIIFCLVVCVAMTW